jgi:hypothetical protein
LLAVASQEGIIDILVEVEAIRNERREQRLNGWDETVPLG